MRKPCNTSSLQQIRPEDLFCYYAICAMAEFEIARVDVIFQDDQLLALTLPAAKFWQPFSQDAGDMAFQNKPHLSTSHFSSACAAQ